MGDECSVWFNAVIRGDVHFIRMGHKVNIQDGAVISYRERNPGTWVKEHTFFATTIDNQTFVSVRNKLSSR